MRALVFLIFTAMLFAAPENDQAAASGQDWVKLVDSGKYADSWKESSWYFRSRIPQKIWVSMIQGVRNPLGALVSRKQQNISFSKTLPGAPDGNYAVIVFQTSFKNKASATETLTMMADGDHWRMAGYFIR